MTLSLSAAVKQARSVAVKNAIDGASSPGAIRLYASPRPATGGTPSGALLATVVLGYPCGTVDSAGLHINSPAAGQAVAAGVIDWGRIVDGDGVCVMDGTARQIDAGDVAGADFIIDVAQVYPGSFVALVSATLAEGG